MPKFRRWRAGERQRPPPDPTSIDLELVERLIRDMQPGSVFRTPLAQSLHQASQRLPQTVTIPVAELKQLRLAAQQQRRMASEIAMLRASQQRLAELLRQAKEELEHRIRTEGPSAGDVARLDRALRELLVEFHPDRNPEGLDATRAFQKVNEIRGKLK